MNVIVQSLLLLLLLLVVCPCSCIINQTVRIPLYQHQYADVLVGEPGKVVTLRLRFDDAQTYLYASPYGYSNTFTDPPFTSDLFYLSPQVPPVRLPVVYGTEPDQRLDTSGGVTADGSLGLAAGAAVWTYWTTFTLSQFTLTLGGPVDLLDVWEGGANVSTTEPVYGSEMPALGVANGTWPLSLNLSFEWTAFPLAVYPDVYQLLFDRDSDGRAEIEIFSLASRDPSLVYWMGASSSVISTSYGGTEQVLRISEREGLNASEITMGRIQTLEELVYFLDMVTGLQIVQRVFDTFPATPGGDNPEALLSILVGLVWIWWKLETAAMVYHFELSGMFPRTKTLCASLRTASLDWLRKGETDAAVAAPIGDAIDSAPAANTDAPPSLVTQPPEPEDFSTLGTGPVDWTMVSCVLFLARLVCFWVAFVALFVFRSARFVAHLAKFVYVAPLAGEITFYVVASFVALVPLLVNTCFIRRYTHAGVSLIEQSLLACFWLARLPDYTSFYFAVVLNLIFATVQTLLVFEWLGALILRGPDSALAKILAGAREFASERDLIETPVTTLGRVRQTAREAWHATRDTLERVRDDTGGPISLTQRPPRATAQDAEAAFVHKANLLAETVESDADADVLTDQEILARSALRPWAAGDVLLLVLWLVVLTPATAGWLVVFNVLPAIEVFFPNNPVRGWMAALYLVAVMVSGWSIACQQWLQILQEHFIDVKEALIAFAARLRDRWKTIN